MATARFFGLLAIVAVSLATVGPRAAAARCSTPGYCIDQCQSIDFPGSYTLADDLTGSPNQVCLTITSSNVTLDLSGWTISGQVSGDCISDGGNSLTGIVVKNGTVTNCNVGINLNNTSNCTIEEVQALKNDADGIKVKDGCIVKNSVASHNGRGDTCTGNGIAAFVNGHGIVGHADNVIEESVATVNGGDGIHVAFGNNIKTVVTRDNCNDGVRLTGDGNNVKEDRGGGNNGADIVADNCSTQTFNDNSSACTTRN